jgi:hypothetical protein
MVLDEAETLDDKVEKAEILPQTSRRADIGAAIYSPWGPQ